MLSEFWKWKCGRRVFIVSVNHAFPGKDVLDFSEPTMLSSGWSILMNVQLNGLSADRKLKES